MIFKQIGFTAKNKIKIATLAFSVLFLTILTNIQERSMIKRLNASVTSLYEDRVIVGHYILSLSNHMQHIIQMLQAKNAAGFAKIRGILSQIVALNILYEKTYLTTQEKALFEQFKQTCNALNEEVDNENSSIMLHISLEAEKILENLADIQVEEGKNKMDEVISMTNTRSLLSYLEIIVIIVISVLIQQLILSTKPSIDNKSTKQHHLN